MATPAIDTSRFQGADEDQEERERLEAAAVEAREYLISLDSPTIRDVTLAYGVGGVLALFLARFDRPFRGELEGETELWVVVGDVPSVYFDTELTPTPSIALHMYCAMCQNWADTVLEGADVAECFPIRAAATREHADMLLGRIEFIRDELIPNALETVG